MSNSVLGSPLSATVLPRLRSRAGVPETFPDLLARRLAGAVAQVGPVQGWWVLWDVVAPFLLTRLALVGAALLALGSIALGPGADLSPAPPVPAWLSATARWDGRGYLTLARDGYTPDGLELSAYAPLLPALTGAGGRLLGGDDTARLVSGLLVSNLALLAALAYLARLIRLDFPAAVARRAVLYVLVFPTTVFLSVLYPHSLFLLGAIGALYYARSGRWWIAGLFGAFAALSRPYGFLVAVPLAWQYLASPRAVSSDPDTPPAGAAVLAVPRHPSSGESRRASAATSTPPWYRSWARLDRAMLRWDLLSLGLPPAAFALWAGYLGWLSGDPLRVMRAGSLWGRHLAPPWDPFVHFFGAPLVLHGYTHSLVELGATILFVSLAILAWRLLRPEYALFTAVLLLATLSASLLASMTRYYLDLFPAFVVLAILGRRAWIHRGYVVFAGCLSLAAAGLYAVGGWVA